MVGWSRGQCVQRSLKKAQRLRFTEAQYRLVEYGNPQIMTPYLAAMWLLTLASL